MSDPIDCLVGQAYFLRFDPKSWEAQQPYAPLGALYAAAVVRERGYRVALFDAMLAQSEAEWAAATSGIGRTSEEMPLRLCCLSRRLPGVTAPAGRSPPG